MDGQEAFRRANVILDHLNDVYPLVDEAEEEGSKLALLSHTKDGRLRAVAGLKRDLGKIVRNASTMPEATAVSLVESAERTLFYTLHITPDDIGGLSLGRAPHA